MKTIIAFVIASLFMNSAMASNVKCPRENVESALIEFYKSTYWTDVTPDTVFDFNIYNALGSDAGLILRMSLLSYCPNSSFHSTKLNQILQKEKSVKVTDEFGLEFEAKRLLTIRELTSEITE